MNKKTLRAIREDALNEEAYSVFWLGGKQRTEEEFERHLNVQINVCGRQGIGMSYAGLHLAKLFNKAVHSKKELYKTVKKAKKGDVILWHDINKKQASEEK
jgi:hypothetical protein